MLFNSFEFLFCFLPLTFIVFYLLGKANRLWALGWLAIASFAFYGGPFILYDQHGALPTILLACSILFNYLVGLAIIKLGDTRAASIAMTVGIAGDLGVLGYFKYSGFLIENFTAWFGGAIPWQVLLPIGISFYTFTQIAFLVDARRGKVRHQGVVEYVLFVTWFPHLVAGPILHHAEMIGQFKRASTVLLQPRNLAIGLAVFSLGLAKKILIADSIAPYADSVFSSPDKVSMVEAWMGAMAYTLQLYFDFSGYSDMAIGLSRLFNVDLPLNFYSPYKATSMIEFWRRWHISLSRFLRDYLYIPLGGNRAGQRRRYTNLMITMVLGGLWHGAAWTFVIWGTLHGLYLLINHAWRHARQQHRLPAIPSIAGWAITFLGVVIAWVFFRSPDFETATTLLARMAGAGKIISFDIIGADYRWAALWITGGLSIALFMPNSQQIFRLPFNPRGSPIRESRPAKDGFNPLIKMLRWRPTAIWAAGSAWALALSLFFLNRTSEFLYFQF